MSENSFFTTDELLRGMPGRRASTILFAIESRTAHLVLESQQSAAAYYLTNSALQEREHAFLDAVAKGRDFSQTITIQDLERYSEYWAPLLPVQPDASLNAVIAHMLAQKYPLLPSQLPGIRSVLGLDQNPVKEAYQGYYNAPLESIYAPQVSFRERLRWGRTALAERIESLPPFWIALLLTIPIGPGLLALPIAMSGVSIAWAIALILFFGLVNMFTATALAETVARSGIMRYGLGFMGQLVNDFLGPSAVPLLSIVMFANSFLVMIIFYLGVGGTLEGASALPAELWIFLLFGIGCYFLSRKSFNSTVASTLVIGLINLVLLAFTLLLIVPAFNPENLSRLAAEGQATGLAAWTSILGVMLSNFYSHMLVASFGRTVIQREQSAHSWIRGTRAAIGLAIIISCLWLLVITGALSPQELSGQTSTVLIPLAKKISPWINWLGSLFVILSLGMASVLVGLALYFQTQEFLPGFFKGLRRPLPGSRARDIIGALPLVGVFVLAEWLAYSGSGNFARLLGFVGVISLPLMGGIYPLLLLLASRNKGDYVPALVIKLLGNRLVVAAIFFVYLGLIFFYGIYIYTNILERLVTILVGVFTLIVTWTMLRRGAFQPRLVFELRDDQRPGESAQFSVVASGQAANLPIALSFSGAPEQEIRPGEPLPNLASLLSASLQIPAELQHIRQVKVWAHKVTPRADSAGLPASLQITNQAGEPNQPISLPGGVETLTLPPQATRIDLHL